MFHVASVLQITMKNMPKAYPFYYCLLIIFKNIIFSLAFRYYGLDAYHQRKLEKEQKRGLKKVIETERTVFNDEEQRRYVLHY